MTDDKARLRRNQEGPAPGFASGDKYSALNDAVLFAIHQRQRATLAVLKKFGLTRLSDLSIFEMGCGEGRVLAEFLNFGVLPVDLFGVDLSHDRLSLARSRLPSSQLINADGQHIPFPPGSFDLVLQYTALSSILDSPNRQKVAGEMLRVLKPGGLILWYDFWLNPINPRTHGIRPSEIRGLFPKCTCDFHKITLAPPLARRLVPFSWGLALFLEGLRILNTHYLVIISQKNS